MSKTGLVIGGPKDGQTVTCPFDHLLVEPDPHVQIAAIPDPSSAYYDARVETLMFQHVGFTFESERTGEKPAKGFWVPVAVAHPELFVLETLAKSYAERAHAEARE